MSSKTSVNLTIPRIEKFKCEPSKSQSFLWDADAKGLGVRATPSGSKAFVFQGRINDKPFRIVIGDVKSWRLDAPAGGDEASARKEARRLQTLCDQGVDPRQEKADRRAEIEAAKIEAMRASVTVGQLWPAYMEANAHKWRTRTIEAMEKAMLGPGVMRQRGGKERTLGALYALAGVKVKDLSADRLSAWLREETAKRPAAARLAFRFLRGFAGWCDESTMYRGLIDMNAFSASRVRENVAPTNARDDCLQREMLKPWFDAVRACSNTTASIYLQTLLLTGARKEEIANLRWEHVDFAWKSINIIRDKTSDSGRIIPLPPYLAVQLNRLPRINGYVFASRQSSTGRIRDARARLQETIKKAGLPHLTIHGLRRSFTTLSEWTGAPSGVVGQIQGHAVVGTQDKHYRRRPLDLLRMWHDRIEAFMLEEACIMQPCADSGRHGLRLVS